MPASPHTLLVSERESDGVRTLLLGLDGVSRSILRPFFESDRLPNLDALFDRAIVDDLESQIPPWTPSAWPSLYTGVNPGKHGAFDFLTFDGYDWNLINRTHVREHAIWELLDQQGLSSVVVNVPVTDPPQPFDGALVPGYIGPDDPTCHPDGLLDDLREEIGEYRVYAPDGVDGDEQIEWYRRLIKMRGRAFRRLEAEHEPDFGFIQFQQTDSVFHDRPDDDDAVHAVFETVDEEVGRILDACDPETVIVASDHGMARTTGTSSGSTNTCVTSTFWSPPEGTGACPLGPRSHGSGRMTSRDPQSCREPCRWPRRSASRASGSTHCFRHSRSTSSFSNTSRPTPFAPPQNAWTSRTRPPTCARERNSAFASTRRAETPRGASPERVRRRSRRCHTRTRGGPDP